MQVFDTGLAHILVLLCKNFSVSFSTACLLGLMRRTRIGKFSVKVYLFLKNSLDYLADRTPVCQTIHVVEIFEGQSPDTAQL
jgi:hypothetical protein